MPEASGKNGYIVIQHGYILVQQAFIASKAIFIFLLNQWNFPLGALVLCLLH